MSCVNVSGTGTATSLLLPLFALASSDSVVWESNQFSYAGL
ncbi:hypothetical protein GLYMA_07G000550v4 [Glycine max]|nr:hypothetical protein GLYMA_07G000550v4 [Glycine max]KAH1084573.1 hypothetical protein GYH30_016935 [Glycine max]